MRRVTTSRKAAAAGPPAAGDWWNGFFDGLMGDFWRAVIPAEATRDEVAFLEAALGLRKGARVLDAPCGHGRHSLELARRGYRVTGIDWGTDLLAAARAAAEAEGVAVDFEKRDMRSLAFAPQFDAAFCAGNSFGYFDDEGNQAYLEGIARALPRGGRFVLESGWIAESLFADFHARLDYSAGGIRFVAENRHDPATGFVENVFRASARGRRERKTARHRVYTCRELLGMVERAGLTPLETWGTLDRRPYALGSPRLLLLAVRR